MPHSQPQSLVTPALSVTVLLWLGLGATVSWMLAAPSLPAGSGLSLAVGLLTLFVAAVVATFSRRYMRADERGSGFFLRLAALVGSVLGALFTNNLIVLGATWCASGWLLAALIGHRAGWSEATAAARRARSAYLVGDGALLAVLVILGWHAQSLRIDAAITGAATLSAPLVTVAALLLVVAAAARCALPPFSGWLLSSMTAPTPVSALMHAGLVNAGGFLLIRFALVLEAAPAARTLALAAGLCGAVYGIGIMMVRPDVKRSLAGSTISQMGFMIMSCGLGAYAAALWHLIAHGLFKAWLFLGSGSTIGMRAERPAPALSPRTSLVVALATLAIGVALVLAGDGKASLVPLLLGLATAGATLTACLGSHVPLRAKVSLVLAILALVALHGAGLTLAGLAVGNAAHPLLPGWALLAVLACFLGAWIWQQRRVAAGRGLPLRLYVHLVNAGMSPAFGNGEKP